MRRCFIRPENISNDRVSLDSGESYHLFKVLRVKPGDLIIGFDGTGTEYQLIIDSIKPPALEAKIISSHTAKTEGLVPLILGQALVKGDKLEFILQKAVELGVSEIVPLITQHVAFHLAPEKYAQKQERWQAIALEACKQCGRAVLPQVKAITPFPQWLTGLEADSSLKLLCYEKAELTLRTLLQAESAKKASAIYLMIGPEGGWAESEVELARSYGIEAVGLGKRILRTETAGLVAASVIQYEYGGLE